MDKEVIVPLLIIVVFTGLAIGLTVVLKPKEGFTSQTREDVIEEGFGRYDPYYEPQQELPTKQCDSPNLVMASDYFAEMYRNGLPLPFSPMSNFNKPSPMEGGNIGEYIDMPVPEEALTEKAIPIEQLTTREQIYPGYMTAVPKASNESRKPRFSENDGIDKKRNLRDVDIQNNPKKTVLANNTVIKTESKELQELKKENTAQTEKLLEQTDLNRSMSYLPDVDKKINMNKGDTLNTGRSKANAFGRSKDFSHSEKSTGFSQAPTPINLQQSNDQGRMMVPPRIPNVDRMTQKDLQFYLTVLKNQQKEIELQLIEEKRRKYYAKDSEGRVLQPDMPMEVGQPNTVFPGSYRSIPMFSTRMD